MPFYYPSSGISGSTNLTRQTISFTTGVLAPQAKLDFSVNIGKRSDILSVKTSIAAWLRIYPNAAYRTSDANRLITDTPTNNYVAVVDIVNTSANLETFLVDVVNLANMELPPSSITSCTVVNTSSVSSAIVIDFLVVINES